MKIVKKWLDTLYPSQRAIVEYLQVWGGMTGVNATNDFKPKQMDYRKRISEINARGDLPFCIASEWAYDGTTNYKRYFLARRKGK